MSSDAKKRRAAARAKEKALGDEGPRRLPLVDTPARAAYRTRVGQLTEGIARDAMLPVAIGAAASRTAQETLDGAFARAGAKTACAKGCSYCCHVYVSVTVAEVAILIEYLRRSASSDELAALADRLRANAEAAKGTTPESYPAVPCAFLKDGACIAYNARPIACRGHHSFSVDACRNAFEGGTDGIPNAVPILELRTQLGIGYQDVLHMRELDAGAYELQQLAKLVLEDATAVRRSVEGEAGVFESARRI